MEQWLQHFYAAIPIGGGYYGLIFLISLVESLVVVGLLMPGSILIVFSGFLAANGRGDPLLVIAAASLGSFIGDLLSFLVGARWGQRLLRTRWLFRYRRALDRSFRLFRRHGAKSVFFGRFIGFFRPFVPFVVGCARMHVATFTGYAAISAVLWGLAYPGLGYVAGASWERVQLWSGRLSLLVGVALVLVLLSLWRHRRRREPSPRARERWARRQQETRRAAWRTAAVLAILVGGGLLLLGGLIWWFGPG